MTKCWGGRNDKVLGRLDDEALGADQDLQTAGRVGGVGVYGGGGKAAFFRLQTVGRNAGLRCRDRTRGKLSSSAGEGHRIPSPGGVSVAIHARSSRYKRLHAEGP